MATVTIYGASDDLVELEGDIIHEEFSPTDAREGMTIAFSDGTILDVHYDAAGVWRVHRSCIGHAAFTKIREGDPIGGSDAAGRPLRSDVATLNGGDITWALVGERVQVIYRKGVERT